MRHSWSYLWHLVLVVGLCLATFGTPALAKHGRHRGHSKAQHISVLNDNGRRVRGAFGRRVRAKGNRTNRFFFLNRRSSVIPERNRRFLRERDDDRRGRGHHKGRGRHRGHDD